MIPTSIPLYVFGCFGAPGHRLRTEARRVIGPDLYAVEIACDWSPSHLRSTRPSERPEGVLHATRPPAGWSIVAWWDRQGDERGGSHTAIAAPGEWTDDELLEAARVRTPWAFRVTIRRASTP